MTPERWTRINELFEHAIELEEPEANAWLIEQCQGDSDLLQEVEKLVRNHRAAGDYLETPATPLSLHEFTQPEAAAAVISTRFEIRKFLGRGGFGDVYAALDRERQVLVAVKHFRERGAGTSAGLIRFKDEFRRVAKRSAELNHRNLVRLYELVQEDSNWFLTMELLDGCDLGDEIQGWQKTGRGATAPQLIAEQARLLLELADGLEALHSAGILHRDIKPSNVWVTADGCLKLLDFGIAKELAEFKRGVSSLGTPDFVAPEQIVGKTCPASDWYSVGVILYQILTGRLPFDGEDVQVMARKQDSDPPPPSTFVHMLPADLEQLCMGLLRRDPTERFGAGEIREALISRACPSLIDETAKRETGKLDAHTADLSRSSGIFRLAAKDGEDALVGRGSELTQMRLGLELAREGKPCCLHVVGESGMGKSALIQQFLVLALAEDADAVVLRGRCYETEVIAYKAFDELLDDLARFLQNLTPENRDAFLPRHVQALARVFPVFQSLTPQQRKTAEAREPSDPVATRREAFRSLRELLARVADRHRLILFMDDLQWGDTDSLAIFREILSGPDAPALLLILAYRAEDADRTRLLREIEKEEKQWTATVMRVPLTPLSAKHSVDLAQRVLPSAGAPDGLAPQWRSAAERIAAESEGNPFLIREFANFVGESSDASQAETTITTLSLPVVLEQQLRRMDAPVARALEVMSVAGGPLDEKIVYAAAEFGADMLAARSAMLSTRLARAATAAKASFGTTFDTAINLAINPAFRTAFNLDLYHARVRSALLSQLQPERKHEIHLAIAKALEESGAADYERMLVHFRGADDREKAALYARRAADRAAKLLAFEHAARMYREVLEVARERPDQKSATTVGELWQLLAGALAHAGRGREAAEAYFEAAAAGASGSGSRPDETESLRLQIRGTEQLLISGHNAEGLSRLGEILPRIGVPCPTLRWRIEVSIAWNRFWTRVAMRRGLGRHRTGKEHELQMDACWSGALGVAMVDPRRSAEFCARHLAWALGSDDPDRISAALAAEAVHSLGDRWRAADPDTLLTEARRMAISVPGRQSEPFVACMGAIVAGLRGRWRDSLNFARRVLTRGRDSSNRSVEPVRESGSVLRLGATGAGGGLRLGGAGWERDTAVIFSLIAKVMLGEWSSAAATVTDMTNEARDRGNRYGLVNFRLLTAGYVTRLAADQPEQALQEVRELIAMWDSPAPSRRSSPDAPQFDLQRYFATVWEADVALYNGNGEEAWAVNEAAWPLVRRSDLLRLQILRISAAFVRGKCAIAAAAAGIAGSGRRAGMLRQAGKARDMLAREDTTLAAALAALLSACIAVTSQQHGRMAADLANAESLLTQAEMIPWAAAVRYRRAELDRATNSAMEPATGELDWMRDQRIVNPQRLVNFLMPGAWS
jgi:hypothetical protein